MVENIIKKIKSLPPLPKSVEEIREICNNPEGSIKELIEVVKRDPLFTADILKAANSPLYGFSKEITSIDQAVSLFGLGTVEGFAISYAFRESFPINLEPYGVAESQLLKISTVQNTLAINWGRQQVSTHKEEMMTTSLLMELGKIVASIVLSETGKTTSFKEKMKSAKTFEEIAEVEKEFLEITSEWITALIFKQWRFNNRMVSMMRYLQNPQEAPENIQIHCRILSVIKEATPLSCPLCEEALQSAYEKADSYGLRTETFYEATEKIST